MNFVREQLITKKNLSFLTKNNDEKNNQFLQVKNYEKNDENHNYQVRAFIVLSEENE